jgi:hypothetical protein
MFMPIAHFFLLTSSTQTTISLFFLALLGGEEPGVQRSITGITKKLKL